MRAGWPFWLLILTAVSVATIAISGSQASEVLKTPGIVLLTPLQGAIRYLADGAGSITSTILSLGTLAQENERIKQQVDRLQGEIVRLREMGEENRELRALLQFERDNPGREYQPASVLGQDPNRLVRSVLVNRGSTEGVRRGMVVVTHLGLAGKVIEVYPSVSKALLINDPSSVVNVVDERSRVEGVVTGRAGQKLNLHYVAKSADVQEGDLLVTSGLGGGYPRGLLVGRVEQVASNDQDLFKTIQVEPAFKPDGLSTVLLVKDFVPVELPRRSP